MSRADIKVDCGDKGEASRVVYEHSVDVLIARVQSGDRLEQHPARGKSREGLTTYMTEISLLFRRQQRSQ
jgi:hypothetical protein